MAFAGLYLDDCILAGPVGAIARAVGMLAAELRKAGLELSRRCRPRLRDGPRSRARPHAIVPALAPQDSQSPALGTSASLVRKKRELNREVRLPFSWPLQHPEHMWTTCCDV